MKQGNAVRRCGRGIRACFVGVLLLLPVAVTAGGAGQPGIRDGTDIVMREKLELSQGLLRGLALEDYRLLQTNATRLARLSEMTGWRALNTPEYTGFSTEFRRASEELARAAADRNLDAATVAYTQLTFSCVSCHKYMRAGRVERTGRIRD